MENSLLETLKPSQNPPFTFPPHRRRPLQSETYSKFVRIVSHCNAFQSVRQHKKKGEAAEENKLVEVNRLGEAIEPNKLLDQDPMETESLLVQQKSAAGVIKAAICFKDRDLTGKRMEGDPLDSLDIITDENNGNQVEDSCNVADTIEISLIRQEEVDKQPFINEVPETVDSSLENDIVSEFSRPIEHGDEKNSMVEKTLSEGIEHELQLKEKELEILISTSGAMNSPPCLIADDNIEEGEISGDIGVYDEAMDFLFDDAVSLADEKKVEKAHIHKDIVDKEEIFCGGSGSNSPFVNIVDNGNEIMKLERQSTRRNPDAYAETLAGGDDMEIQGVDEHDIGLETGQIMEEVSGVRCTNHRAASVKDLTPHGQITSEDTGGKKDSVTNEKDNSIEKMKKKRGPLSKEKKAKKKQKERIKRAEKNRKLGVKRLKLQQISKPKTVTYCRHYLKGRCQEGEKCKFSHDTVPLTKSKPCCHFARHSCMKGDDCPFDHQLSKYPCNNYVAKGFCNRGADCLFSHTMVDKEGSLMTSNVPKPEVKSPFQTSDSNSKKQVNSHGNTPQHFDAKCRNMENSSGKSTEKKVAEHLQRPTTQVPKGISVFSHVRSSPGDTSKHEQAAQPLKGNDGVIIGHKMISSSSDSNQRSNDIMKKAPMRTPKGINFLSFGKTHLVNPGSNKDHGITDHGITDSLLGELNESTLFTSTPKSDVGAKTENQNGQSLLQSESNRYKMVNITSPASTPQGMKFLAFTKVPVHNSSAVGQAGLIPHNINSALPLVQERENALDGLKFSNELPCGLASSSNPFHQSGPQNSVGMSSSLKTSLLSNTQKSMQKALQSTLAFAAKFDSEIKLGQSIGTPPVSTEINQQGSTMFSG